MTGVQTCALPICYVFLAVLVGVIPYITRETWFCKLCPAGMLEGGIPVILLYPNYQSLIGALYWLKAGILVGFLGWMTVTRRPFCRWVCPLGALWSPFNPVSSFRLSVDEERCKECDRCREVCPVDIPLMRLNRFLADVVKKRYDYQVDDNPDNPPPLTTFKLEDAEEFIG